MPLKAIRAPVGSLAFRPPFHERAALEHAVRIDVSSMPDPDEKNRMGFVIRRRFANRTALAVSLVVVCALAFMLSAITQSLLGFLVCVASFVAFCFVREYGYACSQCMQRIHPQARRCPHCQSRLERGRHVPTAAA